MCVCEEPGVGCVCVENHIHLVFCCSTTQLLAAGFGRVKSFECMRVEQKGSQYLEFFLHLLDTTRQACA